MNTIFEAFLDTEWGLIILGIFIVIALLIEFFSNKPQI